MLTSPFSYLPGFESDNRASSHNLPSLFEQHAPELTEEIPDFRKLLENGRLLESIELIGNKATLKFKEKYNGENYFDSITKMFIRLNNTSLQFQELFLICAKKKPIYLILKEGQNFKNGEEVLEELLKCAERKRLYVKGALAKGELLHNVTLNGNLVTLNLKGQYNNKAYYRSINYALHNLYAKDFGSALFKTKFECPSATKNAPTLMLKEGHGFKNAKEVQDFLQRCASKTEHQALNEEDLLLAEIDSQQSPNDYHDFPSYELFISNTTFPPSVLQSPAASPMPAEIQPSYLEERLKQLEAELMIKNTEFELKAIEVELLMNERSMLKRLLPSESSNTTTNTQAVTQPARRFRMVPSS